MPPGRQHADTHTSVTAGTRSRQNARSAKHKSSTHAQLSDRTKAQLPRAPAERKRSTVTVTVCAVCPKAQLLRAARESEEK